MENVGSKQIPKTLIRILKLYVLTPVNSNSPVVCRGPTQDTQDIRQYGYFKVTLPGPDGNFDRLRTPVDTKVLVPPSIEAQLNERQKQIMVQVQQEGKVTSGWCRGTFGVSYNTAYRDLSDLVERGLLAQRGKGRATRYEINTDGK